MKIEVIGIDGTLGSALMPMCDYSRKEAEVVINCAGVVKHRIGKRDSQMVTSNSVLPHVLAADSERLIHVSTDCVFDNNHAAPYDESALPCPTDLYGRSKLAGEIYDAPHLTVRTSFVGIGKRGLLHDLFEQRNQVVKVKKFSYWTGHTTIALSRILLELAEKNVVGLLHIPGEVVSRAELVRKLSKSFELNIKVEETNEIGLDRRLISNKWHELRMQPMLTLDEEIQELADNYKEMNK